jgi:hypothetical protein
VSSARAGGALQNPAYRLADEYNHEGFGVTRRTPRHLRGVPKVPPTCHLPCGRHILPLMVENRSIGGSSLSRSLYCIRATTALAAVAIVAAGCAGANNATSSQAASGQAEQPYKTMYGMTSDGPTTNLYTEWFGPRDPAAAPETAVATAQPAQPVVASNAVPPAQSAPAQPQAATTNATNRQTRPAVASATSRQVQPAPAPVQVAQQPLPPQAPPEPDVPVAYGITANGPTTDLYTTLFGPRRSDGQ